MIIIMNNKSKGEQIEKVVKIVEGLGLEANLSRGGSFCVIGLIGA